ncbi:hypothetical protein [Massilia sp. MS-15]|uniref:hypothetical protein n=1 Tax=Massilia sp. MS-15 TaxID=2878200 RepID=UPI001CD198BE|nr:hypothetical protein [Massilia sp. MS-15]MCA1247017.1 hypothetical protein [Massilia sp. MS-15]
MSKDVEREVLKMYDRSRPNEDDLFETSRVNHIAWSLAVFCAGLAIWLGIALVNAENQRYALLTNQCPDPLFKGAIDKACLVTVHSREHWWEHLWYAATHVRPESEPVERYPARRQAPAAAR